jgi:hypothetical protein
MAKRIELTGCIFGALKVLSYAGKAPDRGAMWWVQCECGTKKVVRAQALKSGATKTCGHTKERHGHAYSTTYQAWAAMITRCTNRKQAGWSRYGGRGISVCEQWMKSFSTFLRDMGERPPGRSLDRIDNSGNYEPRNCRWATRAEQNRNTRRNVWIQSDTGGPELMVDVTNRLGVTQAEIYRRIKNGSLLVVTRPAKPSVIQDPVPG